MFRFKIEIEILLAQRNIPCRLFMRIDIDIKVRANSQLVIPA